ncbi:MAG: hypothetical protein OEW05_02265, partial [Candidatus Aminicenantes bacterium]|nr:hypothetical protein [Candidatus Aminicenantes bacterium]
SVQASILTNTNQSAMFIRLLSRNASTDIDAVYFNPAGLTHLRDGWHFSLSSQTIFQEKTITNDYLLLNEREYVGKVNVPIFPNAYAVYKKNRLAVSFGFGPNAGGGSADFSHGLPAFETPISALPLLLTSAGLPTTAYAADINFEGSSVFFGFQFNLSYALSDMVSIAAGARYISASNTYEGEIKNIMINPRHPLLNPTGAMVSAPAFFGKLGPAFAYYAAATADMAVDAKQTGSGFTPILSLNLRPLENLNLAVRYEFKTKLTLKNDTTTDDVGLFPNGWETESDMPAILGLGAEYGLTPGLRASLSFHYWFDKDVNWDAASTPEEVPFSGRNLIDHNSWDLGFGLEYEVSSKFRLSGGFLHTEIGVNNDYQTDLRHELSSNAVGLGGRVTLSDKISFDIAALNVWYADASKSIPYPPLGSFTETYKRTSVSIAVGVNVGF